MSKILHVAVVVLWLLVTTVAVAQTNQSVKAINNLRQKIDEDITKSEAEPEYSNIYLTELAVNKNNGSYPAVGIYRPVARFYYTYGDREKEPYPNRLLKIVVAVARSDRQEYSEFVFDESEQLVFYLGRMEGIERRLYFDAQRPIRLEENGKVLSMRTRSRAATVATVLKEEVNLLEVFRRSLRF